MKLFKTTQLASGGTIERHQHTAPYATILLAGSYEEAGDAGRVIAQAGEVLLHAPFSCHRNRISSARTQVLDLPLPFSARRWPPRAALSDPDMVARLGERDAVAAVESLLEQLTPMTMDAEAPADRLAAALRSASPPAIGDWARDHGLSREHLSRQFRALYGVSAARYRTDNLARDAWFAIVDSGDSLAMIAADTGFADQAHMSRAVTRLTGRTPGHWRRWCKAVSPTPQ